MPDLTTTPTREIVARVRELDAKASPGEWRIGGAAHQLHLFARGVDGYDFIAVNCNTEHTFVTATNLSIQRANAALISYYRTACVELAARAEAAEAAKAEMTRERDDLRFNNTKLASNNIELFRRAETAEAMLAVEDEHEALRGTLATCRALVERLEYVHDHHAFMSVWALHQLHIGPYRGPTYTEEFEAARHALDTAAARSRAQKEADASS